MAVPDLVEDARGRLHRSRRRFRLLASAVAAAVLLAAVAFAVSLIGNWQLTHQALADAQSATRRANTAAAAAEAAADRAESAHLQAEAAMRQQAVTRADLCQFLARAARDAPPEEQSDARGLFRAYQCPPLKDVRPRPRRA